MQLELDRLVVGEARRGIDRAELDRRLLGEVGVLDDLDVIDLQVRRREERLEHDPARAIATRGPDLLALQVGRRLDPGRVLGEDDVGELAVDRGDVGDRDGPADGRDDAGPVADPDVDGALADQRDELGVDLVLELDVEAGIRVVAVLLGEVELRELDARDVSEPDDELGRCDARLRAFTGCEGGGRRVRGRDGRRLGRAAGAAGDDGDDDRERGDGCEPHRAAGKG